MKSIRTSYGQEKASHKWPKLKLAINGKFLGSSSGRSGVYRVAYEIVQALDRLISESQEISALVSCSIFVPANAECNIELKSIELHRPGKVAGFVGDIAGDTVWEQFLLPYLAKGHTLLNLCNVGPVLFRNAYTIIHDAQVRAFPASYSHAFRTWYSFLQPKLAKYNIGIITVSDYSRKELSRYKVALEADVHVIHNGCDHILKVVPDSDVWKRFELTKKQYVVALANCQAHKNIGILFKAFAEKSLGDVTLVLFGSAERSDFERLGHVVPSNVKFVGRISDQELCGLLSDAIALAFPSLTEGFGLPPLEAMLLGCPVVAAPCGALMEVCGDGALWAAPDDALAWRDQIVRLYKEPDYADSAVCAGRTQAGLFTWDIAARHLLTLICKNLPADRSVAAILNLDEIYKDLATAARSRTMYQITEKIGRRENL